MSFASLPVRVIAAPAYVVILQDRLQSWELIYIMFEKDLTYANLDQVLWVAILILKAVYLHKFVWINKTPQCHMINQHLE
jgi:hypothetical protein